MRIVCYPHRMSREFALLIRAETVYTGPSRSCQAVNREMSVHNTGPASPGTFQIIKTANKIAYLIYCITFVCN